MKHSLLAAAAVVAVALPTVAADPPKLELKKGNVVAVIGNTFADRMQHSGWFDAYLQTRFPELNLRVRHMGFSADEVGGYTSKPDFNKRLRSANFGSGDEWFTRVKADVVVACFGYNESWAGKEGLSAFKEQLTDFIKHTRSQKYNGTAGPQLALVGPIAFEDHKDKNLPNGKDINERLKLYNAAMAEVAKQEGVVFVDLFEDSLSLYASTAKPLTSNGIHPTPEGYEYLTAAIDAHLFGTVNKRDEKKVELVRQAAVERNETWFQRYRATDGYSQYGGRADLKFTDGQTNRVVAQRELEIIDVLTANRDDKVNAVAQGRKDFKLDDSNTPEFIPVKTNKPGTGPGGAHLFASGEDAIKSMKYDKNLKVNLFADEGMFKELVNPVQMAWDTKGRLWVACWATYPHWTPKGPMNDKLLILEDTDGDGKADKCTVFADDLHNPTGFEFWNGGVIVAQAPDIVFLKDTDGDGKYDVKERLISGVDTADTHHTSNSFAMGPGGDVYFQEGTFHHSQIETPYGPPERVANGAVFRYDPRTQKPSVYVSFGFANPHGHVFDKWGQDIVIDGTGAQPYHGILFSSHLDYPNKHTAPPQVYQQRTRPSGGMEILSSSMFPEEYRNNLIVTNCIGFQGLLRYKIDDAGASFKGTEIGSNAEPFLSSTDEKFRPVDAKVGPDGAIYVADWQNPIIGHMQHNLRDPSRDKEHGRIYRVSYAGAEPLKTVDMTREKVDGLLELLKAKDDRVRYRARVELSGRKEADVIPAVNAWVKKLDPKDGDFEHNRLEALWVHQHFNAVDADLLNAVLGSKDGNARSAAIRVLTHWRDRIPGALETLKKLAADDNPRVRLMAVWSSSYFAEPDAVEVPLVAGEQAKDQFVEFLSKEALRAINANVQKAIANKTPIKFTTAAGAKYFLRTVSNDDLVKLDRTTAVYTEMLGRKGMRDEYRREAAVALAKDQKTTEPAVLLAALTRYDTAGAEDGVPFDLIRMLTDKPADLKSVRADLEKLATGARTPLLRQLGYVALVAADGGGEKAYATAVASADRLRDFVSAVPSVRDPLQRAALYPKLLPLLDGLPKELKTGAEGKPVVGRYVRITLPGRAKTLTLAEVEVYSDGKNVARDGKAKQINTAHGGVASRGIDGNKSGKYADGGQTHTEEGTKDPWWEVDLLAEYPIDSVVIYNRTEPDLDARLNDYTVTILDAAGKTVQELTKQPYPPGGVATHKISPDQPERVVRRAAMLALTSVREKEADTFKALAKFVNTDDRAAAIQAMQRIPQNSWAKDDAPKLLDQISAFVAKVPEGERTTPAVLDALQFADALAGLLPKDDAKAARKKLGALGVRVIRVGTLTDQMLFDKDRIVVQAGKPVEFVFENTDIMPHNFVVIQPGSLQEVGDAGEQFGTQPGAQDKNYVPPSNKILLASRLLQPQNAQTLRFNAPKEAGVYPYVCTYPGHWRRMHGALYVVADLEAYAEDPEKYVAAAKLEPKDELLKFNRPRTEWKLEELAPTLAELDKGGRSFARGKQIFSVASCIGCHKFDGGGQEFGPDLTKLDEKVFKGPEDVLKHVLQPSLKIDDKYRTYKFDLAAGGSVSGMVLEKTKEGDYKVIENPLVKAEPKTIKAADLDRPPTKSETSMMPKGLLDKLTKDEILDLIAYVWSKADPKSKYFEGGEHHHGH